ncbi:MAG: hypothetical protein S4CHLAM37_00160 [Chlamydiia bacterium]|nr:hypothetical protein [Chlamydiia bacterium]
MGQLFSSNLRQKCSAGIEQFLKVNKSRVLFYPVAVLIFIGMFLVPFLFVAHSAKAKYDLFCQADELLDMLEAKAKKTTILRQRETSFLEKLHNANKGFLKEMFEDEVFLNSESKALQAFLEQKELSQSKSLLTRLGIIKKNQVSLERTSESEKKDLQEVHYTLSEGVEMDHKDIKSLLTQIETPIHPKEKPQLLFKHFSMERKTLSNDYDTYNCDFSLIERIIK